MITYPNAKINLGLNIVERRPDGYHNLETVFYPIPITDTLEIHTETVGDDTCCKEAYRGNDYTFYTTGRVIDCDPEKNLVIKAYRLMQKKYSIPPIHITMDKNIPFGAGLGGGSADAAFMLKLLNEQFQLNCSVEELEEMAAQLGADCAFFIKNTPTLATGIGNVFSPVNLTLKGYHLVLIKPDIHISTQEAYARVHPHAPERSLAEVISQPIEEWKSSLKNDFEESLFPSYPELQEIKNALYNKGAIYAAMSGSGSSLFGIFREIPQGLEKDFKKYFYWEKILDI